MNFKSSQIVYESKVREAIYYTILRCHDDIYRLYSNQWFKLYKTVYLESDDGLHFGNVKGKIFRSGASHNFHPFKDRHGNLLGIGGCDNWKYDKRFHNIQSIKDFYTVYEDKFKVSGRDVKFNLETHQKLLAGKPILSHVDGLYLFTSETGVNWRQVSDGPIVTVHDRGFINAMQLFGKGSEFDGHVNCIYDECKDIYYLYLRANISRGYRWIQYSTSKDLKTWDKFRLISLDVHDRDKDNYYIPSFIKYKGRFIGLLPYFNEEYCSIRIVTSDNGVDYTFQRDILKDKPAILTSGKLKNVHHPVHGIVEDGDDIHLYIHHNNFGIDKTRPVTVVRHTVSRKDFEKVVL